MSFDIIKLSLECYDKRRFAKISATNWGPQLKYLTMFLNYRPATNINSVSVIASSFSIFSRLNQAG